MSRDAVLDWLLAGDPSIRWQTLRDLRQSSAIAVRRERARVARHGWGARLLALQDEEGKWGGGLYTPKWISTTYTLVLLRSLGLASGHPQAVRGARLLLDSGFWNDGGINFNPRRQTRSETCISGMVLAVLSSAGVDDPRVDSLAAHLLARQMDDGGWNCRFAPGHGGATHGSFHTTITALEALLEFERFRPRRAVEARQAGSRGREFLLRHRLFRSHRTGAIVKPEMLRFVFPPRWHYDVLRGLDYFQDAAAARDPRLADAIGVVERRRREDGRWVAAKGYPGRTFSSWRPPASPAAGTACAHCGFCGGGMDSEAAVRSMLRRGRRRRR
jgi:hypothetical protein